jgi:ABC-type multidrug transport system fused ATPase/permease subunit
MIKHPLFPGQQENEQIYMVLRPHWFIFFLKFLAWLLFAAILVFLDWFIDSFVPGLKSSPYVEYVNLAKSVYLMFLMLGLFILWIMYYLNMQVITNERVVDITQKSLLHHTVSELHLTNIEDVTAEVKGLFGTFLNYGNVYVQTAAETERFIFDHVPNPAKVEKTILDLYEKLPHSPKGND